MSTNVFFNNYARISEQTLIDDLVIESIKQYGVDVIYITRAIKGRDNIFNEDDFPEYNEVFEFEAYVKNMEGFEGEGDFLSKFGLQIRDQLTLTVANRTFERHVTREVVDLIRPREGDLIYFPINEKIFEIKNVEHESIFYQMGQTQVYDMVCELIEYSNQRFNTGRVNIDEYFAEYNTDIIVDANNATLNAISTTDDLARNLDFEVEGDGILDFSEVDPFSENIQISDN
ncbi:MAG: hypothetical protein CBD11_06890 [Phycisphaera sp. TMED151]|nr:MAG: hypothetical protein CBD11_06890 [Phycisphaera sp. TMED151]|tara:strand:+ start:2600 stop:3289 length:690 start_codon:yes stop_codon:yes gene_type:complete